MTTSERKGQSTVLPWKQVSYKRGDTPRQDTRAGHGEVTREYQTITTLAAKHANNGAVSQPTCLHALATPRPCTLQYFCLFVCTTLPYAQRRDEFVADQTESVLRGANVREAAARPLLASGWRLGGRVPDDAALSVSLRAALDDVAADSEQRWGCFFGALTPALSACLEHRALQCAQEMNTRACARYKVCMQHRGDVLLRRNDHRR